MYLDDFATLIKIEYPMWQNSYKPMKTTDTKISCNAVINSDKESSVIGVYKKDNKVSKWFIKKQDGTYIKGLGSSSVYITEQEYLNNVVK